MVVGDQDGGGLQSLEEVGRQQIKGLVVVIGCVGLKDSQTVTNGDARSDDQEGVAESLVLPVVDLVERLPGDKHRHDDGLSGPGGHLERDAI